MPRVPKKNSLKHLEEQLQSSTEIEKPETPARQGTNVLSQRQNIVAASRGNTKTVKHILWDPKRIRPWSGHNRDYRALSEERCKDLIEGFRRIGQQFPAIVRKVTDSADYDFEFVCGARRHWTATFLQRELLVEERKLDDRAAFLLQDIENREREDISDYERACDYAKALPIYFDGKMTKMAEELQIDKGNFSRFMALSELPVEIVSAYADIRELVTTHMVTYNKLLKDPQTKKRVLAAAKKMKGQGVKGRDVLRTLKNAKQHEAPATQPSPAPQGEISFKKEGELSYSVMISLPEKDSLDALTAMRSELLGLLDQIGNDIEQRTKKKSPTRNEGRAVSEPA